VKVIVGLGNPGSKYQGTRHNIGFDVVDYLASGPGVGAFRNKFEASIAEMQENGEVVLLVKPQTFMNLSGRSLRQIVDFYKIDLADVLVVCDDIALPVGKLRVKAKGSHGGQNGLRNIAEQLGTPDYGRLRIGIGEPGRDNASDYVLSRFRAGEKAEIEDAIAKAALAALLWVREGIEPCMNRTNGEAEPKKDKKPRPEKPEKPETVVGPPAGSMDTNTTGKMADGRATKPPGNGSSS